MDRRNFLKNALFSTGALVVGGTSVVSQVAKAGENRDLPIHGPDLKTAGGRKHTPFVKAPKKVRAGQWFEVFVEVGHYKPHPNTMTHWIESVALWIDGFEVASAKFRATQGAPKALFTVKVDRPGKVILRGFGYCNIHGLWVSQPLEVEVI